MARKVPATKPAAFDRAAYLRQLVRERLGAMIQLLMEDSLQSLILGKDDVRPRLPLNRCEAMIDEIIWHLEQHWGTANAPAVVSPAASLHPRDRVPAVADPAPPSGPAVPEEVSP